MRKIAFLDRDGTLIIEPPVTYQVNSLDEMVLLPHVISSLKKISDNGYDLVIITNQDGLGTDANPAFIYNNINKKMFEIFASEDVHFKSVLCCPHYLADNCNCRKPKTKLIDDYLKGEKIDMEKSFVVGDRDSDLELAKNLGIRGFKLDENNSWDDVVKQALSRKAKVERATKETKILVDINLDGDGKADIKTGLNFFDHMLHQIAKHGSFDLTIHCDGDTEVDEHHTIEDVAIALGQALKDALGDKKGIERYSHERIIVMDECKCEIGIDLSGRAHPVLNIELNREYVGDFPTEMLSHFFHSFAIASAMNIHATLTGENTHHQIECFFKALAKSLKDAVKVVSNQIVSTKGVL
ncbi:MAG: Histidine biosynthesis bifunctional protein HisB [Alphaproteobacteria bacterium ADurb.Bin438]|nr:MAG: Histidine biosynthesis bifunctional protein HisB [Alphaproteobacteria bacterium ADurb.Bin438]